MSKPSNSFEDGLTPTEKVAEIIRKNEAIDPMFYADPNYKPIPASEFASTQSYIPFGTVPNPSSVIIGTVPISASFTYLPNGRRMEQITSSLNITLPNFGVQKSSRG